MLEALLMGSTLGRRDDVDEGAHLGVVARAPPQCDVDGAHTLHLGGDHVSVGLQDRNRLLERSLTLDAPVVGDRRVDGEVVDELRDTAFIEVEVTVPGNPRPRNRFSGASGRFVRLSATSISSPGTRKAV